MFGTIKQKAWIILVTFFFLFLVIDIALQKIFVLADFEALERIETQKDIERCIMAFDREIYHLDILNNDWAAWSDTHSFVAGDNPEFVEANLPVDTFKGNHLHLLYIINLSGEVVFGKIFDETWKNELSLKGFQSTFRPEDFLVKHEKLTSFKTGIYPTERGYLFTSSRPIITSERKGPINGTIIMGRFISKSVLKELSSQTRVNFTISEISPDTKAAYNGNESKYIIEPKSRDIIEARAVYKDMFGLPALNMIIHVDRDITKRGKKSMTFSVITIIIVGTLILLLIIAFLRFLILSPLSKLVGKVTLMRSNQDISITFKTPRTDELGILSNEFENTRQWIKQTNDNLETLVSERTQLAMDELLEKNAAQEALKVSEDKYKSIFENMQEVYFEFSFDGVLIEVSPSIKIISKYERDDIIGLKYSEIDSSTFDLESFFKKVKHKGEVVDYEALLLDGNQRARLCAISARLISANVQSNSKIVGSIRDITQKAKQTRLENENRITEAINSKLIGSIRYAKVIQNSLLPNLGGDKEFMENSFVLWMPKDVVSGDIYFKIPCSQGFIIAVIDCTGHGVPGAFMTIIATSGFRRIVRDGGTRDPALILKALNAFVKSNLQQDREETLSNEGLDASICFVNTEQKKLTFAGARQSRIVSAENKTYLIKGDRHSLGYKQSDTDFNFTNHEIEPGRHSLFYLFSDGIVDQLGGTKNIGFGVKRLINLIARISELPFDKQKEEIMHTFLEYKQNNETQDDITLIGFKA